MSLTRTVDPQHDPSQTWSFAYRDKLTRKPLSTPTWVNSTTSRAASQGFGTLKDSHCLGRLRPRRRHLPDDDREAEQVEAGSHDPDQPGTERGETA